GVPAAWRTLPRATVVRAPRYYVRASQGWVDARLAFWVDPELSQAFGGALTTARGVGLSIEPGLDALVFVRGRLLGSDGRVISKTTPGYRWVPIASNVKSVSCDGECVVALQGIPPKGIALNPRAHIALPVAFEAHMPWLISASLPPGPRGMLRYNVAYDDHWAVFAGGGAFPHFRVDATVNGWIIPQRNHPVPVVIIEWVAALQALFEIVGALWILALLCLAVAAGVRVMRSTRRPSSA
ncbi:MAG: hypothetical protein KGM44_11075, partial [bacterium]|nr:hypothetical protein [bacterium]